MQRRFLDWTRPIIHTAAEWLVTDSTRGSSCNLQKIVCVVPGRRAGRLLLHALAMTCRTSGVRLVPPEVVTPGVLLESLWPVDRALATNDDRLLAWMAALRETPQSIKESLLPSAPDDDDLDAWFELANTITRLHEELSGHDLAFDEVPQSAEELELFAEGDRWQALAAVADAYRDRLRGAGVLDPPTYWKGRLDTTPDRPSVVLVGITDLTVVQRRALERVGSGTALVHAPDARSQSFDEFGCVEVSGWTDVVSGLHDDQIFIAEGPDDQAQVVMDAVAKLEGRFGVDEITLGVGDDQLIEPLSRAARFAGLSVHDGSGRPLRRTPPWRLLEALSATLDRPGLKTLAAIVRHRDLDRWLGRSIVGDQTRHRPTLLDRYQRGRLDEALAMLPGDKTEIGQQLRVLQSHLSILQQHFQGRPRALGGFSTAMLELLSEVYGPTLVGSDDPDQQMRADACLALRDAAASLAATAEQLQPDVQGATALRLLLRHTADERLAPILKRDQIELLGWLELTTDDTQALILAGCHEGAVPRSITADPFLPDMLRQKLGLDDDTGRCARDRFRLESILHARKHFIVCAGRLDAVGEPQTPSRLLFDADDETIVRRLRKIARPHRRAPVWPRGVETAGESSGFTIPPIPDDIELPTSMAVTDFKGYLECPYRYALDRLFRLVQVRDDALELDALDFGTLAHAVLNEFASLIPDETDAREIERVLIDITRFEAANRFGPTPPAAVTVQIAHLEQRLAFFASCQAELRSEGWRIRHSEVSLPETCVLAIGPGQTPMPIRGRIDRIDQNEKTGRWRIIDYKTSAKSADPMKTHNGSPAKQKRRPVEWLDLQLPLYLYLARHLDIPGIPEVAYIALPDKAEQVAVLLARWTPRQIIEGIRKARGVVMDIRARRFDPVVFRKPWDKYARICQTSVPEWIS